MSNYNENVIFNDQREIESVSLDDAQLTIAIVGHNGVTKIEAYREYGTLDFYPCLMIWKGDFLWQRVPAVGARIIYRHPTSED